MKIKTSDFRRYLERLNIYMYYRIWKELKNNNISPYNSDKRYIYNTFKQSISNYKKHYLGE